MMEIPESTVAAAQLDTVVKGKQVREVILGTSPHKFFFTEDGGTQYNHRLSGKSFGEARPYGIYIEIPAGDMALLIGEGLSLRYIPPGEPRPKKHQMLIELEDGDALAASVQMYGGAWVYPEGTFTNPYYLVAVEKPSPLTDSFDEAYFQNMASQAKPTLSAKAFLATEQRIPGLGNGVLQDILFTARIHPKKKIKDLSKEQFHILYKSVKELLPDMVAKGGRDTEKDLFGQPGGYKTILSAKTWKNPCPVCGGTIEKQAYLGGSIYFCPHCQPL